MSYTISSGIVDNDDKGKTGRGTVHWLTVSDGPNVLERHEWGLLEELAGKFNKQAIITKYVMLKKQPTAPV